MEMLVSNLHVAAFLDPAALHVKEEILPQKTFTVRPEGKYPEIFSLLFALGRIIRKQRVETLILRLAGKIPR